MKSVFFGVFSVFPKFPKFDKLVFFGVFPFFRNFCGTICGVMWRYEIGDFWCFFRFSEISEM